MASVKLGKRLKSNVFEAVFGDWKRCCESLRECYTPKSLTYSEPCSPDACTILFRFNPGSNAFRAESNKLFERVILLTMKANSRKCIVLK